MELEDLTLVSVDDHVVEPAGPVRAAAFRTGGATGRRGSSPGRRHRRVALR